MDENAPFRLPEDVEARLDQLDAENGFSNLVFVYKEIFEKNTRVASEEREYAASLTSLRSALEDPSMPMDSPKRSFSQPLW